ncbi:MAG: transporter [Ferruginibacter sp.]|nr:transporter [Ferruginibacter sp.]
MKQSIRVQLSAMMLLQFFIWGSWYVTMGTYLANTLKADGLQIGVAYGMMAIATIISPLLIGVIADRFFAPRNLMALLHFAGGIILLLITRITDANTFNWVLLLYALMYAPTMALSNSIAFDQLKNTGKSFSAIRVFGTVGWIIAGISIDKVFSIPPSAMGATFTMAGVASIVLAILSLMIPKRQTTIASPTTTDARILGKHVFVLFKNRSFTIFFIASILICIPLSFYYSLANQFFNEKGLADATSKMTMGQFSEAIFILMIPFFMKRFGIKWMIIIGMLAWIARFVCFRYGDAGINSWMLIAGIILHGVCYDFFFVTGQIYTDSVANDHNRNAAQGMITMATYGVGLWIGSLLSGYIAKQNTINSTSHHWEIIWLMPIFITVGVLLLFSLFFTDKERRKSELVEIAAKGQVI